MTFVPVIIDFFVFVVIRCDTIVPIVRPTRGVLGAYRIIVGALAMFVLNVLAVNFCGFGTRVVEIRYNI